MWRTNLSIDLSRRHTAWLWSRSTLHTLPTGESARRRPGKSALDIDSTGRLNSHGATDFLAWPDKFSTKNTSSSPTLSLLLHQVNGNSNCWKSEGLLNLQPFSGPTVYNSEAEAAVHRIAYGQRIIDEKVPGVMKAR